MSEGTVTLKGRWASATALLADRPARSIVVALAEHAPAGASAEALVRHVGPGASERLVRDRLRALVRAGVVQPPAAEGPGVPRHLTPAGLELHRLLEVMRRVIAEVAAFDDTTPAAMREGVVELTLKAMADPIVLDIGRALAAAPREAGDLERACRPIPRRTLYRRLELLVAAGAVERETIREVPRRTVYTLVERWRPVVTIPLLSAWWEWRHGTPADPELASDLAGLARVILPRVQAPPSADGARLRWHLTGPGEPRVMTLEVAASRLRLVADDDAPVAAEARGSAQAWATALVTGDGSVLTLDGDMALARRVGEALRAALLAPLAPARRGTAAGRRPVRAVLP